ncbi:glycosyltransferase family 4 protein [Microbacterium sp. SORGH_AS_0888]|uniref:glycosyltransferase family 4 protein n=1 Tax=Microbacterium sp. SORGH_AS_0888 TaxID=3041791 RepID=UPI0027859856|nr:glycosyltransferase family 4 protein [Microbacterium sp. SORGH_AS_0888]MDQ1130468.1 glycosyltransferase involved in cell wall biosynthesis [Microbacterium sp. SORGH_AS_0888]
MTILFAHPGSELYGSDRMIVETIRAAVAAGAEAHLVIPDNGPLKPLAESAGAIVEAIDVPVLRKEFMSLKGVVRLTLRTLLTMPRILKLLRAMRPEAVWVNTITQPSWMFAAWFCRIPLVVHVRESEHSASRLVQRLLIAPLALASLVVSNSKSTQDFVRQNMSHFRARKRTYKVIYNGKEWDRYFRSEAPDFRSPLRLLLVGRLSPRKGQDVVLQAMNDLHKKGIATQLTLAGEVFPGYEWYRDQLQLAAAALPAGTDCRFIGFVEDPSSVLEDADIVLVPSRTEPFGTVAAEAMAAKRPVIVSAVDGLVEVVENGVTGLTFSAGDPIDLAAKISYLHQNPSVARSLAASGWLFVNESLSAQAYARNVQEALEIVQEGGL